MYRQADVVYLYDSSWQGFLCCIFEAFFRREEPFAICPARGFSPTLYESRFIDTDPEKADRVDRSIDEKLGPRARELVSLAFLNGSEGKELALLRFLRFAYPRGRRAPWFLGSEAVAPVLALEKAVTGEAHLLKGFLRFQEYDGLLTARITPKHYVLPLLRGHFCSRFPEENFLICDVTHGAVLLYRDHAASYLELEGEFQLPPVGEEEARLQRAWKHFYETLTIQARENLRCRMTHCPKRYWENMTELQHLV